MSTNYALGPVLVAEETKTDKVPVLTARTFQQRKTKQIQRSMMISETSEVTSGRASEFLF